MSHYRLPITLSFIALLATGCGADNGPAEQAAEPEQRETAFDPMVETLDRAKEVEELGKQRKAEMDERLKQLESGSDPDN